VSCHFKRGHELQGELRQLPSSLGKAIGTDCIGEDHSPTVSDARQL